MPVFPAVPSTIVPPGRRRPFASASRIIYRAALSFTDCPGFTNSALPKIEQPVASEAALSLIKGVFPMLEARSFAIIFYQSINKFKDNLKRLIIRKSILVQC